MLFLHQVKNAELRLAIAEKRNRETEEKLNEKEAICADQASMLENIRETIEMHKKENDKNDAVVSAAEHLAARCMYEALCDARIATVEAERDDFQLKCRKLSKQLKSREESEAIVRGQLIAVEDRARIFGEQLAAANDRVCALTAALERQKCELVRCAREAVVADKDGSFRKLENQLQELINYKRQEAGKILEKLRLLEEENACLKSILRKHQDAEKQSRQSGDLSQKLSEEVNKLTAELNAERRKTVALVENLECTRGEMDDLRREFTEAESAHEVKQAEQQTELDRSENLNRELLAVTEQDRDRIGYYQHELETLRETCRRFDWFCREQSARIANLQQQNQALRSVAAPSELERTPAAAVRTLNYEKKSELEKGDALDRLSIIEEADEKSSTFQSQSHSADSSPISSNSPTADDIAPPSTFDDHSPHPTAGARDNLKTLKPTRVKSKAASSRQFRRRKSERSGPSTSAVFSQSTANGFDSSEVSDDPDSIADGEFRPQQRRFGLPMTDEEFERIFRDETLTPVADGKGMNQSHDDGYGSSVPSRLRHENANLFDSSSSSADSTHENGEDFRRYRVFYEGVRFDVASFSLARMRNLTFAIESTHTPDGMCRFLEFLASKAEELERHPHWRGRHTLGKPSDWLKLKQHYA